MKKIYFISGILIIGSAIVLIFSLRKAVDEEAMINESSEVTVGIVTTTFWNDSYITDKEMTVVYFANNLYYEKNVRVKDYVRPNKKFVKLKYSSSDPNIIRLEGLSEECYFHNKISIHGAANSKVSSDVQVSLFEGDSNGKDLELISGNYLTQVDLNKKYGLLFSCDGCQSKVVLVYTLNYNFDEKIGFEICNVDVELEKGSGIDTVGILEYSPEDKGMVASKYK